VSAFRVTHAHAATRDASLIKRDVNMSVAESLIGVEFQELFIREETRQFWFENVKLLSRLQNTRKQLH